LNYKIIGVSEDPDAISLLFEFGESTANPSSDRQEANILPRGEKGEG